MSEQAIVELVQAVDTVFWAGFMLGVVVSFGAMYLFAFLYGALRDRV